MNPHSPSAPATRPPLLGDFSLEMTGKDVPGLEEAAPLVPPGTRINVTFLGNEDQEARLGAALAAKRLGFRPVPHMSARRLASRAEFEAFLDGLRSGDAHTDVFAVGGDPARPQGPYPDALSLIESGLPSAYGVRHIGIAGYPEGHPAIASDVLWATLRKKSAAVADQGLGADIITQFGFDADPVLAWIERVRDEGITLPVRVGVPGPAGVRRLLNYAKRFGVGTSTSIARKYGLSLTNLMGTAGPDRFLHTLAEGYDPARHGEVKIHFYTFGGLRATSEWVAGFTGRM
ncbi:methylenetetrahydrofolate reductase [Streptomyces sp. NPDC092952]|uniref:methylenetetrahydrofolate reductase n=1 Tax=Streptomyces sp. NPDC092952 TaxID=3366018 RepID=UPI003816E0D5